MPRDFLPASDAEFDVWIQNYNTKIGDVPTLFGLAAADVAALGLAVLTWTTALGNHRGAQQSARARRAAKDEARAALATLVRRQVRRVQSSPAVTDAQRSELRVTVPEDVRTSVSAPSVAPVLRLDFGVRGRLALHASPGPEVAVRNGLPAGAVGFVVQCHAGAVPAAGDAWALLGTSSRSPFVHEVGGAAPQTYAYRAAYVTRRQQRGPWSAPVVGTANP